MTEEVMRKSGQYSPTAIKSMISYCRKFPESLMRPLVSFQFEMPKVEGSLYIKTKTMPMHDRFDQTYRIHICHIHAGLGSTMTKLMSSTSSTMTGQATKRRRRFESKRRLILVNLGYIHDPSYIICNLIDLWYMEPFMQVL